MRRLVIGSLVFMAILLTGCAGMQLPLNPSEMTPEQLAAWAKVKDAQMGCVVANTPYGRGVANFVNTDRGVLPPGSTLSVDAECKITLTTPAPAK